MTFDKKEHNISHEDRGVKHIESCPTLSGEGNHTYYTEPARRDVSSTYLFFPPKNMESLAFRHSQEITAVTRGPDIKQE